MGLLLLLGSALLIVLAAGPRYSAGQSQGVLIPLTAAQKQEFADKHNECRRHVDPPASDMKKVFWDDEAAVTAANWVKQCKWAHSPIERRTISTTRCGENIYKQNSAYAPSVPVQYWCAEQDNFVYGTGAINEAGLHKHYTQVAWASSCYVGCAMAKCGTETWTVCHQCPPGNVSAGKVTTPYASGPSCSKCPGFCENNLCTNACKYENMAGHSFCESNKGYCTLQQDFRDGCRGTCKCT